MKHTLISSIFLSFSFCIPLYTSEHPLRNLCPDQGLQVGAVSASYLAALYTKSQIPLFCEKTEIYLDQNFEIGAIKWVERPCDNYFVEFFAKNANQVTISEFQVTISESVLRELCTQMKQMQKHLRLRVHPHVDLQAPKWLLNNEWVTAIFVETASEKMNS